MANDAWWRLDIDAVRHLAVNPYGPSDRLPWHTDAGPLTLEFRLALVAMLFDPDDYEGGGLEFRHEDEPTHLPHQQRGDVAVYPAHLLHRVTSIRG